MIILYIYTHTLNKYRTRRVTSETMSCRNRKGGMFRSFSVSFGRVMIDSSISRVTAICRTKTGGGRPAHKHANDRVSDKEGSGLCRQTAVRLKNSKMPTTADISLYRAVQSYLLKGVRTKTKKRRACFCFTRLFGQMLGKLLGKLPRVFSRHTARRNIKKIM